MCFVSETPKYSKKVADAHPTSIEFLTEDPSMYGFDSIVKLDLSGVVHFVIRHLKYCLGKYLVVARLRISKA